MSKLLAIVRREYVETVRTKAFAFSTVLVPLLMGVLVLLPGFLARKSPDEATRIGVLDRTGKLFEAMDKQMASDPNGDFLKNKSRRYPLTDVAAGGRLTDGQLEKLERPYDIIQTLNVDVLVEIKKGVTGFEPNQVIYYSSNVGNFEPIRRVEKAINSIVPALRLEGSSLSNERITEATTPIDVVSRKVSKEGKTEDRGFGQEWITAMTFAIGLYTTTLMAGLALSRGLLEEKANRVVEVLISSVTPFQLMTGKILGHALVILSQLAVWIMLGAAVYLRGLGGEDAQKVLAAMNPTLLSLLSVYFLLGYFLYASLFAAVGAICTTEMEAQQTQTPLVLMQIIPLVLAIAIVKTPGSTLAVTLSMIPFFAPSVMMIRMAVLPPPVVEILASIALLILSVLLALWAVSKIFRVGILMTGKKMTIQEVFRWMRSA